MKKEVTKLTPADQIKAMGDVKKMSKAQLVKAVENFVLPLADPAKYREMIKGAMPDFVKEMDKKEDAGTVVAQSGQEMLLAFYEALERYFGFTYEMIKDLNKKMANDLKVTERLEDGGLSILSMHSMKHIGDLIQEEGVDKVLAAIAETRFKKEQTWRTGLEHPNYLEGSKIAKRLTKQRK